MPGARHALHGGVRRDAYLDRTAGEVGGEAFEQDLHRELHGGAYGLVTGRSWEDQLRHAVALGAASVASPVAGEFSQTCYAGGLAAVAVRQEAC